MEGAESPHLKISRWLSASVTLRVTGPDRLLPQFEEQTSQVREKLIRWHDTIKT